MIEIDSNRSRDSELQCKHNSCRGAYDSGMGAEEMIENLAQTVSPDKQHTRTGSVENEIVDQEQGWSKVGPREKNKNNKK